MHQTLFFLGPKSIDAGHDVNLHLTTKKRYKQTLTAKASVMREGEGMFMTLVKVVVQILIMPSLDMSIVKEGDLRLLRTQKTTALANISPGKIFQAK